jgi:diaminopimelate decarboxylase
MRKEAYDNLCKEALEKIEQLPENEQIKPEIVSIGAALDCVLAEEDEVKLEQYYSRIDEFYSVNPGKGLEYMNGNYLLTGAY